MAAPPPGRTLKGMAQMQLPNLPFRRSQRQSKTMTQPVSPRTFQDLVPWPNFTQKVHSFVNQLDDIKVMYAFHTLPMRPVYDEDGIRGAMEYTIYGYLDVMAEEIGIPFCFIAGGSGRSYSYSDQVILDTSVAQPSGHRKELSGRVHGNGELKGPWQWEIKGTDLLDAMQEERARNKHIKVIQQLYGDMILDETRIGYVSNYDQTIFFRRPDAGGKVLEFSPVVRVENASLPVLGSFLFVLTEVFGDRMTMKQLMRRTLVPTTPTRGYTLTLPNVVPPPQGRKRTDCRVSGSIRTLIDTDRFDELSAPTVQELGLTGCVAGMGKYGNVLEGSLPGSNFRIVLKTFDLRHGEAAEAFVREQKAYIRLQDMEEYVAACFGVGRLPHCNVVYIALADVGTRKLVDTVLTRHVAQAVKRGLDLIHEKGVLHGDLKASHVLFWNGGPKFVDFDRCTINPAEEDVEEENMCLEELLGEVAVR